MSPQMELNNVASKQCNIYPILTNGMCHVLYVPKKIEWSLVDVCHSCMLVCVPQG